MPPFLFQYIDGGANDEQTLRRNVEDFQAIALKQRVLKGSEKPDLSVELFGEKLDLPIILAPVGLTGMYARRGEVQAALAAASRGTSATLSTMSICALEEVASAVDRKLWFQLYVLRDRGFMKSMLERAEAAGVTTLVFTVDLPVPGARYRDAHSGMSGPNGPARRFLQAMAHPAWAWDVGIRGGPHTLGNVSHYLGKPTGLADYIGWIGSNFDPAIGWKDLQWIRDSWRGALVIKGILDPDDARDAVAFGADGIVVSNHGGRQLDGVLSTARALPEVAAAVKGQTRILLDSGIRSGLDVVRAVALGADAVMIGRAYVYALAAGGQPAVAHLLDLMASEARVAMILNGAAALSELGPHSLASVHAL